MIRFCIVCNSLIEGDGVPVDETSVMSGPGITIYAHREHAHLVERNSAGAALLARIRARRAAAS
ncbi:hypothetical protein ABZ883_26520 [Streptomyces sp. NPDC046977]|uniref:hypothetical protein n=1 Tax=Streptomyces sp. NPDC046977 TaxID=3154703 RepID=UPI00340DEE6F